MCSPFSLLIEHKLPSFIFKYKTFKELCDMAHILTKIRNRQNKIGPKECFHKFYIYLTHVGVVSE